MKSETHETDVCRLRAGETAPPEILAPAGDEECVRAAVAAGADAVYLGFSRFNARRRAKNIGRETFPELVAFAHAHGTGVYVTFNTLVLDSELGELIDEAGFAAGSGVDGFIVQDYGAAYLFRNLFPEVPLHASTQMTTHTAGQIRFLHDLGFSRVNLARELSLEDIRKLTETAHSLGLRTEIFVHGAHCTSYSGQCLMSSYLGGQSGNRGICFQPCRRRYGLPETDPGAGTGDGDFAFSLKDNGAAECAGEIIASGADALKIEGRVKGPYYVQTAVSFWRTLLDGREIPDRSMLGRIFNRGFTTGYFSGRVNQDMFVGSPLDRSKTVVGTLGAVRVLPRGNRETEGEDGFEHAVFEVPGAAGMPPGTRLCISTEENRLIARGVLERTDTSGALTLRLDSRYGGLATGQLLILDEESDGEERRASEKRLSVWETWKTGRDKTAAGFEATAESLLEAGGLFPKGGRENVSPRLALLLDSQEEIAQVRERFLPGALILFEACSPADFPEVPDVFPWFPEVMREADCEAWERSLRAGPHPFIVAGNSSLAVVARVTGTAWVAGPGMNVTNSLAVEALSGRCGASGAVLSPELTPAQAACVGPSPVAGLWVSVYGPVRLMTMRACPLARYGRCGRTDADDSCFENCAASIDVEGNGTGRLHLVKRKGHRPEVYGERSAVIPEMIGFPGLRAERYLVDLRRLPFSPPLDDRIRIAAVLEETLEGKKTPDEAALEIASIEGKPRADFPWGLT